MRPALPRRPILAALLSTLAGGAQADGYYPWPSAPPDADTWLWPHYSAAREAALHLQFEVRAAPHPETAISCTVPAVVRRVFRADSETLDQPPRPVPPVQPGTALVLVMPCDTTAMPFEPAPFNPARMSRSWYQAMTSPYTGSRQWRLPIERRVPRPGDVMEAFLSPSRSPAPPSPGGPADQPAPAEEARWSIPAPLTAMRVTGPGDAPRMADPPRGPRPLKPLVFPTHPPR
ncbi:hypothetical protein VQH23_17295 [Pararoseomonas sp. SCSIO 73927]|uniref:hypothetical protein n=1 Tax=Pararoseomonas sp. SCSIO 73927 TaxID=3114537 RepID=UPI0030CE4C43